MRPAVIAALAVLTLAACSTEPIAADPSSAPSARATQPAGPASDFSATGKLPCSADSPTLDHGCIFGISLAPGGLAALQVVNPTADVEGIQRVLLYKGGVWSDLSGAPAVTRAIEGATLIEVDGREYYALPNEVFNPG